MNWGDSMGTTGRHDTPESEPAETAVDAATADAHLADAAMALLGCRSADDVYEVICDFMAHLCPGAAIIVDEITPDVDCFITRKIAGVEGSLIAKAADLMGFEIVGKRWPIPPAFRDDVLSGSLSKIPGGFADLASGDIPPALAAAVTKILGIYDLYAVGITDREGVFGNFAIVTRTPGVVLPAYAIESFARHCFSALAAIAKTQELARNAERGRLLIDSMVEGFAVHEIILDAHGMPRDYRFLDMNAAFETMTGLKAHDVIGCTVKEVLPGIEPEWIEVYGAVATTGVPARFERFATELDKYFGIVAYSPEQGQFAVIVSDITQRRRAEEALRKSEQRFRVLFDTASDGIFLLDTHGVIVALNPAFAAMHGYSVDEMLSMDLMELDTPDTARLAPSRLERLFAGEPLSFEAEHYCKSGATIPLDVSANLVVIGEEKFVLGFHRDITLRKQAERALELSEAKFSTAFDTSPDAVNINRLSDGMYIDVNQGFTHLTGYTKQDVAGKTSSDIRIWDDMADRDRLVAGLMRDGMVSNLEARFRRKDGSLTTALMSARTMEIDGEQCILSVTRDIADRKAAEEALLAANIELEERVQERTEELSLMNEELRVTNEELIESNTLLAEATAAKSAFLASMSHELRTPLNSIIGFTGILLQGLAGPLNPEQQLQLGMVNDSGKHLLSVVDDILDLARIESGKTTARINECEIPPLAERALELLHPLAEEKGIELSLSCGEGADVLRTDARLLTQILVNLLGNAVKFTDVGSVSLDVSVDGEQMLFAVTDTGRGIHDSDLPHILESFYQADNQDQSKTRGTGLGLTISSQLATILGGALQVVSEFGVGSTFTLRLPLEPKSSSR